MGKQRVNTVKRTSETKVNLVYGHTKGLKQFVALKREARKNMKNGLNKIGKRKVCKEIRNALLGTG